MGRIYDRSLTTLKYSQDIIESLLAQEGIILAKDGYSYENSGNGNNFEKFVCYCCLKKYDTWEESRECRRKDFERDPNLIPAQMIR